MGAKELFEEGQKLLIEGKQKERSDEAGAKDAFSRAVGALSRAIEATPAGTGAEPAIIYLSRGVAYLQLKDADKAIADFTKAIEAGQKIGFRAYYYRGIANMIKNALEPAVADLTKAIELKPEHGAAIFARGAALAQLDRDEEATKDIKTALSHSEAGIEGFADTLGIIRTQFDKAMSLMTGQRPVPTMELSEKETETLRKWLEGEE